ncbi:hypothetical protein B0H34DRAFT_787823 [Crassisporium funariophilum]|nr:hypothetical protein B0H34DRAFT_787823 [Crassisporium funariophilum]
MMPTHNPASPFPTSPEIVDRALLLATLPSLSTPHFLTQVITWATIHTRHRLVIVLFSRHFNIAHHRPGPTHPHGQGLGQGLSLHPTFPEIQGLSHTKSWDAVQRILTFAYVQATKAAWEGGKVLMEVDVLLKGLNEDLDAHLGTGMDIVFRISGDSIAVPLPSNISFLRTAYLPPGERNPDSQTLTAEGTPSPTISQLPPFYPVTALGGTFDHLHAGHKILLSMGAYITGEKLIVGITDDSLLQNKANQHVLEKLPVRTERVRKFLQFFKPSIEADIVPINDVYGPTGWDPNIQALVVSKETLSGAEAIASHRQSLSLPPLQPFLIDVISSTHASLDHADAEWLKRNKLSSTFIRQWIVDCGKQEEEEGEGGVEVGGWGWGWG